MHVNVGDSVKVGDSLFTIHGASENKLDEAITLAREFNPIMVGSIISGVIV